MEAAQAQAAHEAVPCFSCSIMLLHGAGHSVTHNLSQLRFSWSHLAAGDWNTCKPDTGTVASHMQLLIICCMARLDDHLSVSALSTPDKVCLGSHASLQLACLLHAGLKGNVVEPGSFP